MSEQPEDKTYTVSAAALDQIHGRIMAAEIIAVRLWGFLSMTQPNPKAYLEGQITQCLQSTHDARGELVRLPLVRGSARCEANGPGSIVDGLGRFPGVDVG